MKRGYYATKFERFFAYFIDMLIIFVLNYFIIPNFYRLFNFDVGIYNDLLVNLLGQAEYSAETLLEVYEKLVQYSAIKTLIDDLLYLILIGVFLVGFAVAFKGSTIGQKVMKIKMVKTNGSKVNVGNIIARQLVFYVFFIAIPGITFIFFIINIVCICSSGISLIDRMSGTKLVSTEIVESNTTNNYDSRNYDGLHYNDTYNNNSYNQDNYEHDYHDSNNDNNSNKNDSDDDDDDRYKII